MELQLKPEQPELFIGRQESSDIVLKEETVSRKHARIILQNGDWFLEDLHSKHGTLLNGESIIPEEKRILHDGDKIQIGDETLEVVIASSASISSEPTYFVFLNGPTSGQKLILDPQKSELILGRSPESDIVIDNKNISRKHAKLKQDIDGVWLEDLSSKNGVLVNDQKILAPVLLKDSDQIQLGDLKLELVDTNAALLKRLSVVPAFNPPESESPPPTSTPEQPTLPPQPVKQPSHMIDYLYMGLMSLIVIGLLVGAYVWVRG